MSDLLNLEGIWFWGLVLIVLFPLLILVLNELGYFLIKKDPKLNAPIRTIRNFVLPLSAVVILLIQILDYDREALSIKVIETLIWVLVINAGLALMNRLFFKGANKNSWRGKVPQLFLDIFRVFLVLVGGAIALSTVWGVDMKGMATALGLGSFVLGLALQDTLGNLFSGIALVYERPFSVGDYIKVEDNIGEVIEMNWRAVRIRTREGELIVIPHLMIGQVVIINYSLPTRVHVIKLNLSFSHHDPPNKVKEALMETCINTPGILLDPEPEIKVNEYGESAIIYEVEFGIEEFKWHEDITDEFMTRVWYTAQRYHLIIPHKQLVLHQAETKETPAQKFNSMLESSIEKLPNYLPIERANARELLDGSKIQLYGRGEYVLQQGEKTSSLFILLEGEVGLYVSGPNGKQILINSIHEGDFFGEVALLSSRTNSMSAKAESDIRVLNILSDEVMDMVSRNPRLAHQLDEVMDSRRMSVKKELE